MHKKLSLLLNLSVAIALFAPSAWLSGGATPARADGPAILRDSVATAACPAKGPHDFGRLDKDIVLLRDDKIVVWDPSLGNGCDGTNPVIWQTQGVPGPTFVKWVDIATGDFNGDGKSEIVVVGNSPSNNNSATTRVIRVYDPLPGPGGSDASLVFSETPLGYGADEYGASNKLVWTHVTTGDVNRDGKDEIVTLAGGRGSPTLYVYNVVLSPTPHLVLMCMALAGRGSNQMGVNETHALAVADLTRTDGQSRPIVAAAEFENNSAEKFFLRFVDPIDNGGGACPVLAKYSTQYDNHNASEHMYDLIGGDIDGDGKDEIAVVSDIGSVGPDDPTPPSTYRSLAIYKSVGGGIYSPNGDWYNANKPGWGKGIEDDTNPWPEHYFTRGHVALGDLDGIADAGGVHGKELVAIRNQSISDRVLIKQPLHTGRDAISKTYPGKDPENPDTGSDTYSGVAVGDFYGWKSAPFERVAMFTKDRVYLFNYSTKYPDPIDPPWFVKFTAAFGDIRRMVVGAINGPRLEGPEPMVNFLKLEFGPDPSPRAMPIYYSSTMPCTYTASISPTVTWLQVTPATGAAPGNVTLQVTGAISTLGVYTTVVTFSGQTARWPARGTINVPVTLKVVDHLERNFLPVILARAY